MKQWLSVASLSLISLNAFAAGKFTLSSDDLKANAQIGEEFVYNGMDCSGQNVSPELHWANAPKGTKSFAVTSYDPDAPTGSGWWHWVTYNIPASISKLEKGASKKSAGSELVNDFGAANYDGPCPGKGKPHRYIFTVFALKSETLTPPAGATTAYVRYMIEGDSLGKATLTAKYGRAK